MFLFVKNNIESFSDDELVVHYKKSGNKKYLAPLFERYSHLLFGLCLKYLRDENESKDAVLNIFEKLIIDLKTHQVNSFRSWIYMVGKNHCLMQLRAQKSVEKRIDDFGRYELSREAEDENASRELQLEKMEEALETLKEEQKICIRLFYLEEKCYNEIVETTGFSIKNVKSYIQNGKRNLKIKLMENYGTVYNS